MKKTVLDERREKPRKKLWNDIENHPRFLQMIEEARKDLREGRGVRLEDVEEE